MHLLCHLEDLPWIYSTTAIKTKAWRMTFACRAIIVIFNKQIRQGSGVVTMHRKKLRLFCECDLHSLSQITCHSFSIHFLTNVYKLHIYKPKVQQLGISNLIESQNVCVTSRKSVIYTQWLCMCVYLRATSVRFVYITTVCDCVCVFVWYTVTVCACHFVFCVAITLAVCSVTSHTVISSLWVDKSWNVLRFGK